jgi:hypothetical protein
LLDVRLAGCSREVGKILEAMLAEPEAFLIS